MSKNKSIKENGCKCRESATEDIIDKTHQHIALTTKLVSEGVECCANEILKKYNITTPQAFVLGAISRMDNGECTLKELEKQFIFSSTAIAGSVLRLERKGYITSFIHPADKRIKCVKITQLGEEILETTKNELIDLEASIFEDFTEEEKMITYKMLRKAYNKIEQMR